MKKVYQIVLILITFSLCGKSKINNEEYKQIEDYIYEIGIENGYMQDLGEHEEEYVPDFKNSLT